MKFMRRPDLDAQSRIQIVMQAWLNQGVYGKMTQLAQSYQISRTFLYQLLFVANLHLEMLFSEDKLRVYHEQRYALRLLGDLVAHREPREGGHARDYYHQALSLAEALGMRPLQAHCHRSLGMLYAATGQAEQARAALSTAVELYHTMEMTFWLPQVEAVRAQMAAR